MRKSRMFAERTGFHSWYCWLQQIVRLYFSCSGHAILMNILNVSLLCTLCKWESRKAMRNPNSFRKPYSFLKNNWNFQIYQKLLSNSVNIEPQIVIYSDINNYNYRLENERCCYSTTNLEKFQPYTPTVTTRLHQMRIEKATATITWCSNTYQTTSLRNIFKKFLTPSSA